MAGLPYHRQRLVLRGLLNHVASRTRSGGGSAREVIAIEQEGILSSSSSSSSLSTTSITKSGGSSGSRTATAAAEALRRVTPPKTRLTWRRLLTGAFLGSVITSGAYVGTRDEATLSKWGFEAMKRINPLFGLLDPESAHRLAIWAASKGLVPKDHRLDPAVLGVSVWGRTFSNPIGLAAGFDKDAKAVEGLLGIGFGFVEVGSVTPVPQDGNPKPRVFRLREQEAIINRYGFNSEGIMAIAKRLGAQSGKLKLEENKGRGSTTSSTNRGSSSGRSNNSTPGVGGKAGSGILGVNLGKNKTSSNSSSDYIQGVHSLAQYADYLVINVSSPNTPGLRMLQGRKELKNLLKTVLAARDEMQWGAEGPPPLLVKIAPDLSHEDLVDIAAVALSGGVDGLVISNTTVTRPESVQGLPHAKEAGGLSGKPLLKMSTDILREMYQLTRGRVPLVGVGGVSSGEDAYSKIRAGASLVQLYTTFAYEGPAAVPRIKAELAACLEADGYKSVAEAVGADFR